MPATVALLVLAGPLTVAIFHYGEFDEHDVRMSTLALMAYSSGLLGFSLVKVLAPGFFARQDTRTPVRIGVQSLGVNMGLEPRDRAAARAHARPPGSARAARAQQRHRRLVQLERCCTAACAGRACCNHCAGLAAHCSCRSERDNRVMVRVPVVARRRHARWLDMGALATRAGG